MSEGVRQEGDELLKVVESLRNEADEFNKLVEEIYAEIEKRIGETEDTNKGWWGPKAGQFLTNVNDKRKDFTAAYNTMNIMAQNLEDQVTAWDQFEA